MEILGNQSVSSISARNEKIDLFLAVHGSKFFAYQIEDIRRQLSTLSDSQLDKVMSQSYKDPLLMFMISLGGGILGIDRFLLDNVGLGIIKLITCGGFYIWWIVDLFLVQDLTREYNANLLSKAIAFSSAQ